MGKKKKKGFGGIFKKVFSMTPTGMILGFGKKLLSGKKKKRGGGGEAVEAPEAVALPASPPLVVASAPVAAPTLPAFPPPSTAPFDPGPPPQFSTYGGSAAQRSEELDPLPLESERSAGTMGADPSRGEEVSRAEEFSYPGSSEFLRGSLDVPLASERGLHAETERVAGEIENFSREDTLQRVETRRLQLASPIADIFETPMRSGLYGVTRMDVYPFKIVLNSKVLTPRRAISLVHELLHVYTKLHKKETLPHAKLHDLSIFLFSEVLPPLRAGQGSLSALDKLAFIEEQLAVFVRLLGLKGFTRANERDLAVFVLREVHPVISRFLK